MQVLFTIHFFFLQNRLSRRLNYLEAVLMEVQRHSNVAPLAIAHRSVRNTSIHEYIIPKVRRYFRLINKQEQENNNVLTNFQDTLVLASIWSIHMDEQHWGDPEVFRPERFLDNSGNIINDSWFMPFGVGK